MRKSVLISLSMIVAVATSVALYLLLDDARDDLDLDADLMRSTTLVVQNPPKGARASRPGHTGLVMGLQVRLEDVVGVNWATGQRGDNKRAHVVANVGLLASHHYNLLGLTPEGADDLRRALEEPHREELWAYVVAQAHLRGLKAYVDVSSLVEPFRTRSHAKEAGVDGGSRVETPSEAVVAQLVSQLLDGLRLDGVTAKGLPPSYAVAVHQVTLLRGKSYVQVGDSPKGSADVLMTDDWVAESAEALLPTSAPVAQVASLSPALNVLGTTPSFGYSMAVLSHARSFRSRAWARIRVGGATESGPRLNLALLQATQFGLDGCVWLADTARAVRGALREPPTDGFLQEMIRLRAEDPSNRPLANLVLALPREERARRAGSRLVKRTAGPVINGLAMAGYDVRTTYGAPLEGAAAYAVLAVGRTERVAMDVPQHLLDLLDRDEPVVFVVSGLAGFGQWRSALLRLGLRSGRRLATAAGAVPTASFGEHVVRWHDPAQPPHAVATRIVPEGSVSGEIEVTAEIDGVKTALVVRTDNKILVNGGGLDLETSFVFNRLVNPTLHEPFAGLGTVGRRSAFFALRRTQLRVDLPVADGAELRLIRYGSDGRQQPVEIVPYQPPFSASMQVHELLIVEASAR